MRCYPRLLNNSNKDHITNEDVHRKIQAAIGKYDTILSLPWSRNGNGGGLAISQGLMAWQRRFCRAQRKEKERSKSRQKKRWADNIKEWTGMDFASSTWAAEDRTTWKMIVKKSSMVP